MKEPLSASNSHGETMPMQIEEESGCENDNFVDGILQDELKIVVFTQTILLQEQLVLRLKCLFVLTLFYSILFYSMLF